MPVLAALYYMTQAVHSAFQEACSWRTAGFGIHLLLSQVKTLDHVGVWPFSVQNELIPICTFIDGFFHVCSFSF